MKLSGLKGSSPDLKHYIGSISAMGSGGLFGGLGQHSTGASQEQMPPRLQVCM